MKKISLSLFILSVVFIIFMLYYPEKQALTIEAGNIKVVAVKCDSGAATVRELLAQGREKVDSIKRPVIGEAAVALEKYLPESPLMNFAADALHRMAQRYSSEKIDVAITNKGGLRSNLQQGTITFGDIYSIFPFENTLAFVTLNGEQLLQLCREVASVGGEAISGLRLEITPQGGLLSAMVNGEPVDAGKEYRVATSDYLSQGNDKMTALALGVNREIMSSVTVRDLMVQYVKELAAEGKPVTAECDGRIKVIE